MKHILIVVLGLLSLAGAVGADDWPAWRGPAGNGISPEKKAPLNWGPDKNIKWKAALPHGGNGSPIVSNGRVFVTCQEDAGGLKRSLYCFDRKDGKQLWVKTVDYGKKTPTHGTNFQSSSTPVADGKRVVAWHDAAGLFCYDFEGKELWTRNLGEFYHVWGHGGSPILHDGKVILNCGPGQNVFLTALDLESGKTLWKTDEPQNLKPGLAPGFGDFNNEKPGTDKAPWTGSWCTPVVAKAGGKNQVICAQATRVVGYDAETGKIVWWCEGLRRDSGHTLAYSSPIVAGDVVFYTGGFGGPGFGIRLGGQGDVTKSHRVWHLPGNPQSIGSGIFLDGLVYVPFEPAIQCRDPKTGKTVWQDRGVDGGGYWGSIVMAAGRCYVTSRKGDTVVFKPSPEKCEVLAVNPLGESSNSTPAISDGEIFIRTFKHLYCIAE